MTYKQMNAPEPTEGLQIAIGGDGYVITHRESVAGWRVTMAWTGVPEVAPSRGPNYLEIELDPSSTAEVHRRGITSGVLREVERVLLHTIRTLSEVPALRSQDEDAVASALKRRIEKMPDSPRANRERYYSELLALLQLLKDNGRTEPLNDLASALSIPKNTLKTQLRTARNWLAHGPRDSIPHEKDS